jgi:hypothetical protein
MFRKILIGVAVIVGPVIVLALISSNDLGLEVRSFGSSLVVKNIGTGPTKITDIMINERTDCSALTPDALQYIYYIHHPCSLEDRHKFWVKTESRHCRVVWKLGHEVGAKFSDVIGQGQ